MTSAYTLTKAQQHDREKCLQLARELHRDLHNIQTRIKGDKVYYLSVKAKVEQLNTYAKERYKALQRSIFFEGGENYFSLLGNFDQAYQVALDDLKQKYSSLDGLSPTYSQWRGPMVKYMVLFVIFYIAVSIALAFAILRFLPQRLRPNDYAQKRKTYHTALGLFIFAISIFVVRLFIEPGFTMMAIQLMTNVAWLAIAIVCSLLVRLNGKKIQGALRLYLPFVLMAFVVVSLRVMFLPNSVVQLLFPPLLLGFAFWQVRTLRRPNANIPTSDVLYSAAAMIAICCSTVMAWMGYVMMAVQVIVWWMFQLAALQTINAIYHLMSRYERRVVFPRLINSLSAQEREGLNRDELIARIRQGAFITRTWGYDFVNRAVVPVFCVCSVFLSVWYAAGVFEVTDIVRESFAYNFINKPGLIQLSLHKLSFVVGFWFVFSYLNYAIRSFYQHITRMRGRLPAYQYNFTLANNVIAILVWGAYVLYALVLLQVPKSGIGVVTAGLATGMGFAMKDLLENFFYGISLMTGRVRVGDYIECDGVTGRVESITYQSTQIATLDGSIIAFLNTQLFNKNFKNLTRNHNYVLVTVPFGVSYGTNVDEVRKHIVEAIKALGRKDAAGREILDPNNSVSVVFKEFGDSSVDLLLCAWVLVPERIGFASRAKEVIYNTLNAHNIEIPFPQCDVHMKQS